MRGFDVSGVILRSPLKSAGNRLTLALTGAQLARAVRASRRSRPRSTRAPDHNPCIGLELAADVRDDPSESMTPTVTEEELSPTEEPGADAEPIRPDVFISYSRKDAEFVGRLRDELAARGKDVWLDLEDIRKGEDWWRRIERGIQAAAAVVAVLSPDFLSSEVCGNELDYAIANNKRLVPVVARAVDAKEVRDELRRLNWLAFAADADFERSLDELVGVLEADFEWLDRHARLNERAHEWEAAGRDPSFLLQRNDLAAAERWLDEQGEHEERATALQTEYILASRRAATKRQRRLLLASGGAMLGLLVLALVAVWQWRQAVHREHVALSRQLASSAVTQLSVDPELSLILSAQGADHAHTVQAERALRLALAESHVRARVPLEPKQPVHAAFAPDGRYLLALARNGAASAVNVQTGKTMTLSRARTIAKVPEAADEPGATVFAPDGSVAALIEVDGSIEAWRPGTWTRLARWPGRFSQLFLPARPRVAVTIDVNQRAELRSFPSGAVVAKLGSWRALGAAITPDGRAVAVDLENPTDDQESNVRLWFGPDWKRSQLLAGQELPSFSANGRWLGTSAHHGPGVTVWSARTGKIVHDLGRDCLCTNGSFTPDGRLLITNSPDGTEIHAWSPRAWEVVHRLRGDARETLAASSRDGTQLMQISDQGVPSLSDLAAGHRIASLRGHTGGVLATAFGPDGMIETASTDGSVRTWDAKTWTGVRDIPDDAVAAVLADGRITAVVTDLVDLDHSTVLEARVGRDGQIFDWQRRASLDYSVDAPALSRGGRFGAFNVDVGRTDIWILRGSRPHRVRTLAADEVAFSPDGKFLAAGAGDSRIVTVYATGSWNQPVAKLPRASDASTFVPTVALSPGGKLAFIAPYKQNAAVWRVRDGTRVIDLGNLNADAAVFSPDGARLLIAAEGQPVRIYDAGTGEVVTELLGHTEQPTSATFSPDGKLVLTTALDSSVRIWDVDTGEQVTVFFAPLNSLLGASFDDTGRKILTHGAGVVRIAACAVCGTFDDLRERAAQRVTRTLTASERRLYGD
jgi:WD40 repeat protein